LHGPFTERQFFEATTSVQRQAAVTDSLREKTVALWRMERLGFSYCRQSANSLNSNDIPLEIQPISHVGLGIAVTESAGFSAGKIIDIIESRVHSDFRLFPYESVGCLWAAYSYKWFQRVFRIVSQTHIPPLELPEWKEFAGRFPAEIQRLISHGYGRTLYLKESNVARAIRAAMALDGLHTASAVQGIAFAYAMINHVDLVRVLDVGTDLKSPDLAIAFRNGLIYALAFWDWAFPGFLRSLVPRSDRQDQLIASAHQLIEESHQSGRLVVFGVV